MAKEATLKLGKNTYNVLALDYMLYKPCDNNLKPSAATIGGLINFTIKSPKKGDHSFYEWMTNVSDMRDGEFILPVMEGIDTQDKKLKFESAHCVSLQECYSLANKGNSGQTGYNQGLLPAIGSALPIPFGREVGTLVDWGLHQIPGVSGFLDMFGFGGGGGSATSIEMYMKLTISAAYILLDEAVEFRNKALPV